MIMLSTFIFHALFAMAFYSSSVYEANEHYDRIVSWLWAFDNTYFELLLPNL